MPTITVRGVSDALYSRLSEQADQNRRSISQEAALLLERALEAGPGQGWDLADRVRERMARYGIFPDSTLEVAGDRRR
ncbi:MAG: hypothetical protein WD934_03850 [Gemmatimonadales bacterium]